MIGPSIDSNWSTLTLLLLLQVVIRLMVIIFVYQRVMRGERTWQRNHERIQPRQLLYIIIGLWGMNQRRDDSYSPDYGFFLIESLMYGNLLLILERTRHGPKLSIIPHPSNMPVILSTIHLRQHELEKMPRLRYSLL